MILWASSPVLLAVFWTLLGCAADPAQDLASMQGVAAVPAVRAEVASLAAAAVALPVPDTIAVRHILIAFEGSRATPRTPRTRAQAEQLSEQLHTRLLTQAMAPLAIEFSDDNGSAARGGWLGAGQHETWVPSFSAAAFGLQEGQLSAVTESPFGFHLIQRVAMEEIHLLQILVQHNAVPKVWLTDGEQQRQPAQAKELAQRALAELSAGTPFAEVAAQYSDGPMALRGGDLGLFLQGELGPAFDQVAMQLEPGERSGVFGTDLGYHVLQRPE